LKVVYEKRRAVTRGIAKFWPVALMNNGGISIHVTHKTDQVALSYLEDIWVEKDEKEPRCFTIEFVCFICWCTTWEMTRHQ
jgi:template-activating factor I